MYVFNLGVGIVDVLVFGESNRKRRSELVEKLNITAAKSHHFLDLFDVKPFHNIAHGTSMRQHHDLVARVLFSQCDRAFLKREVSGIFPLEYSLHQFTSVIHRQVMQNIDILWAYSVFSDKLESLWFRLYISKEGVQHQREESRHWLT
jgi:hypothetical protein